MQAAPRGFVVGYLNILPEQRVMPSSHLEHGTSKQAKRDEGPVFGRISQADMFPFPGGL